MRGHVLSIEIGNMYTYVADIKASGSSYTVERTFAIPTPESAYEDGYIINDEELCEKIVSKLAKYSLMKRKVAFMISSSKIINREIVLPYVSASKVKSLVMANASDYFPVDLSKYKVSYKIMNTFMDDKNKKMKLMVIAVPQDLLDSYYSFAKNIGMSVEIIDYSGNSIYQMARFINKESALVSVNISESNTIVSVVRGGILEFQRIVPHGIYNILLELSECGGEFNSNLNLKDILDQIKSRPCINPNLPENHIDPDMEQELGKEAYYRALHSETLRNYVDRINRVIHYYTSSMQNGLIDQLLLTGPGVSIVNLPALLQFEIGLPVKGISSLKNIKFAELPDKTAKTIMDVADHAPTPTLTDVSLCIGALISPMDLLPANMRASMKKSISMKPAIACAVASTVICAGMFVYVNMNLTTAKQEQTSLTNKVANLSQVEQVFTRHAELSSIVSDVKQMVNYSRVPTENLVVFIDELEEKLPVDTQVTSISINSGGVNLGLKVTSWEAIADTISQLKTFSTIGTVSVNGGTENDSVVTSITYEYYVNGEKVDSITDALTGESQEIIVEEVEETQSSVSYDFNVSLTWKSIEEYEATEAATQEGGVQ